MIRESRPPAAPRKFSRRDRRASRTKLLSCLGPVGRASRRTCRPGGLEPRDLYSRRGTLVATENGFATGRAVTDRLTEHTRIRPVAQRRVRQSASGAIARPTAQTQRCFDRPRGRRFPSSRRPIRRRWVWPGLHPNAAHPTGSDGREIRNGAGTLCLFLGWNGGDKWVSGRT